MTAGPFAQYAEQVAARGWRPVPTSGKGGFTGWNTANKRPWTDEELADQIARHGDANVGLAIPAETLAMDVDILRPDLNAHVRGALFEVMGATPLVRIGRAPKFAAFYRSDGSIRSQRPRLLDIYSGTGLVVGLGIHPSTRQDYRYEGPSILDIGPDDPELPLNSAAQVAEFVQAVQPAIRAHLVETGQTKRGSRSGALDWFERWAELEHLGWTEASKRLVREGAQVEHGRHDCFWTLSNIALRYGKGPDDVLTTMRIFAPSLLDYIGGGSDDYVSRTLSYVFDR